MMRRGDAEHAESKAKQVATTMHMSHKNFIMLFNMQFATMITPMSYVRSYFYIFSNPIQISSSASSSSSAVKPSFSFVSLLALIIIMMTSCGTNTGPGGVPDDAQAIERNNRAVGLMGKFDYDAARRIFAQLAEQYPDWNDIQINLAIATLNRQQPGDEQTALSIAETVLERDPDHLRAHYIIGILKYNAGRIEQALPRFQQVAEADPDDAHAAYYTGQCLMQQQNYEQALTWFERAIDNNPYIRSAYYAQSRAMQRLGRDDEAERIVSIYQQLDHNPRATLVEIAYTKMGEKAEAIAIDRPDAPPPRNPKGPLFHDPTPMTITNDDQLNWTRADTLASITTCDINGDDALDVFLTNALQHDDRTWNAVLINNGDNTFSLQPTHPLAQVADVNAALWGDYDNDGRTDVYLCRNGVNQLWRNTEGGWHNVTESTGTGNGFYDTTGGAMFDADHDGDLDIFCVNANGPNELLNNNRDGSFQPIARQRNIAGGNRGSKQIIAGDLDRDRDMDVIVIHDDPPHDVFINHLLWEYNKADNFALFTQADFAAATLGDVNADGRVEIYTIDSNNTIRRWQPDENKTWRPTTLGTVETGNTAPQLALADITGDGTPNLIATTENGFGVYSIENDSLKNEYRTDGDPLRAWLPVAFDPARGPAVIAFNNNGPRMYPPGTGRHGFLALSFTGREDEGQSMRSNASGIGAFVAVRSDSRWSMFNTLDVSSTPGQSLQPTAIGLAGEPRADYISIEWSDGVFQSEIDLEAGKHHRVKETQRQLSSCPVLFAWDGEEYKFISDILGVGGIGFNVGAGEYASPRPWENFMFPDGLLQPREGQYIIKIGEPMEEACYLDSAQLVAYDLPPGWNMTLDERFAINGPQPTGKPKFYNKSIKPARVINDRNTNITADIAQTDFNAAPIPERDERFIGRLAKEHTLTLEFDQPIDSPHGEPTLIINGWVEYPYSQTMFAAWQADAAYRAPTLEARDAGGTWRTVVEQFGYPAGMPREMSMPLNDLPPGTTALRFTTNLEIYFDRIAIAYAEPCPQAKRRVLTLEQSKLHAPGFAQRDRSTKQRRPLYDYSNRTPLWDTRHQRGWYTDFGRVDELITESDNALAIFGPGEEVELRFNAPQQPAPENGTRIFVLETTGWCKDMDLYTKQGETLAPMPLRGEITDKRNALHNQYNTRYRSGR